MPITEANPLTTDIIQLLKGYKQTIKWLEEHGKELSLQEAIEVLSFVVRDLEALLAKAKGE